MWIFAQEGFFSIVEDRADPDMLVVRSRIKGDIEKYWPDSNTAETPEADYLYRACLPRQDVAVVVARMVLWVDYSNFKDNIADHRRSPWYLRVWTALWEMQHRLKGA